MDPANDGNIRISGRLGEVFIVRRPLTIAGGQRVPGPPVGVKLMEVESIEATKERTFVDVNLPGTGETGSKRSSITKNGTMTVQKIFSDWELYVNAVQFGTTLQERRRARDIGQRVDSKLTLQVWLNDDAALGAEGWQVSGVDIGRLSIGLSQDDLLNRELPFRFDELTPIRAFQRLGAAVDPVTGLPAIEYVVGAPS